MKRSNRLDAVLNKKIEPIHGFGFNGDIKLDFDFSRGYALKALKTGKLTAHFNKLLIGNLTLEVLAWLVMAVQP
ncbi:MAG: hypothetical protein Rsou_1633 [Candidatus Ruthia sp. Asou_11_S2]|nr:hypothetical protein [Candidatus Ruthia sp. Asou_11_S2]